MEGKDKNVIKEEISQVSQNQNQKEIQKAEKAQKDPLREKKQEDNKMQASNEEKKEMKPYLPYSLITRIEEPYPDITLNKYGVK